MEKIIIKQYLHGAGVVAVVAVGHVAWHRAVHVTGGKGGGAGSRRVRRHESSSQRVLVLLHQGLRLPPWSRTAIEIWSQISCDEGLNVLYTYYKYLTDNQPNVRLNAKLRTFFMLSRLCYSDERGSKYPHYFAIFMAAYHQNKFLFCQYFWIIFQREYRGGTEANLIKISSNIY